MRSTLLLAALLAGCSLTTHKIDIQQGNYIDQTMVSKLKPGMTRAQVRFVLGTPLIADAFHSNRWDYVFMTGKAQDVKTRHRITVIFDGDKLRDVAGDFAMADALRQAQSQPAENRQP